MSMERFSTIVEKVLLELPGIDTITLSGFGEFLLDPSWREKVLLATRNFTTVHIVTNGSLLTPETIDFLLPRISDIRVSVYGMSETVYRTIHRPPGHVTLAGITGSILSIMDKKDSGQRVILNYLECDENRAETAAWIDFWEHRVDLIEVWKPHNWIDGHTFRSLTPVREKSCGRPASGPVQVQVDGTVNVCCFDYNGEMVVGDAATGRFADIFDGPAMTRIQQLHESGKADDLPLCARCDQRNARSTAAANVIYNSRFSAQERVHTTSTGYDRLADR